MPSQSPLGPKNTPRLADARLNGPDFDGSNHRRWSSLVDASDGTLRYRPLTRGPQPSIVVFDEFGLPGETIVIRHAEYRIGRESGDLMIPHDLLISATHARLVWRNQSLTLLDDGSRNGTYLRLRAGCSRSLRDGDRFLCGRQVFQFASPAAGPSSEPVERQANHATRLIRLSEQGGALHETPLSREAGQIIGRDPHVSIPVPNDAFLSPRHARIRFDRVNEEFVLDDMESLNGVFVRITAPEQLADGDMFRLGEQLIGVLFPSASAR